MAITRDQANTITGKVARRMCQSYWYTHPIVVEAFVRTLVREAKDIGTASARTSAKAIIREIWTDAVGTDPVGDRLFRKWLSDVVGHLPAPVTEADYVPPIQGISADDAFDAIPEEII